MTAPELSAIVATVPFLQGVLDDLAGQMLIFSDPPPPGTFFPSYAEMQATSRRISFANVPGETCAIVCRAFIQDELIAQAITEATEEVPALTIKLGHRFLFILARLINRLHEFLPKAKFTIATWAPPDMPGQFQHHEGRGIQLDFMLAIIPHGYEFDGTTQNSDDFSKPERWRKLAEPLTV